MEFTADAMASVAPLLREYFGSREGEVGARMIGAWEAGIRDSLGLVRGLTTIKATPPIKQQRIAKSDGILLEFLRQKGGSASGTLKEIADRAGIPQSTLSASVKRLEERGFVQRSKRRIILLPREV